MLVNKLKKTLVIVLSILILLGVLGNYAGISPGYLISAPGVGTGIGSKLLCSSRYVSGFSQQQSFDDLIQYSSILERLSIEYDDSAKRVNTSLFGLSGKSASFYPGIGCAVDYPGFHAREQLEIAATPANTDLLWPAGSRVRPADPKMQAVTDAIVARDNAGGLNSRALLVVHRGHIVAESYAQNADAQTPLLGWSMAKSLTSIMLANLEYRGLLDLNAKPGFQEWAADERNGITIPDLLTMTDGLAFSEQYNPGDDATAMLFTVPSNADFVLQKELQRQPGEHFNYSSGTANLLSRLYYEAVGGSPQDNIDDYQRHIALPFGFQNAVFEVDAGGTFVGSSYFYASGRDWARMGQLMLNGGEINGQQLVSEQWIARATAPNNSGNEKRYGYQWWLNRGGESLRWPDLPIDSYAAMGNRQQIVMVVPSRDLVVVRLGWTAGRYPHNENIAEIISAL